MAAATRSGEPTQLGQTVPLGPDIESATPGLPASLKTSGIVATIQQFQFWVTNRVKPDQV